MEQACGVSLPCIFFYKENWVPLSSFGPAGPHAALGQDVPLMPMDLDGVRAGGVDHDADGVLLPSLDLDAEHVGEVEELLLLLPDVARSVQVHYGHPH